MARIDITKETGTTPDSIAKYLLHQKKLDNVPEQYRIRLENWIINENKQNEYKPGSSITIPDEDNILEIALIKLPLKRKDDETTVVPLQLKGWKLSKDTSKLIQVSTGWLTDENGLYILKDGRRVTEAEAKKPENNGLRFGTENDPKKGLEDILGAIPSVQSVDLNKEYNSIALLNDTALFDVMPVVIFQALQINACYTCNYMELNANASFYSIGLDETGIPIVVTQIEAESTTKKLVIAGPHGDERNAQRLIMTSQKHFIKNGPPEGTVLYFIPCISPTMCFADARGIPNEFWQGGKKNKALGRGPYKLIKDESMIIKLHEMVTQTVRDSIQKQNDPQNPTHGVDANRDYYRSLPSSKMFYSFIETIKTGTALTDSNMDIVETRVLYKNQEIEKPKRKTIKNIRVFMIHGYVGTGAVYGPYAVSDKGEAGRDNKIVANMSDQDRIIVRNMMDKLGFSPFKIPTSNEDKFFYDDTKTNAAKYQGEWTVKLYEEQNIWTADIELSWSYNEGIRYFGIEKEEGNAEILKYDPSKIGLGNLPYFHNNNKFYDLLRNLYEKK